MWFTQVVVWLEDCPAFNAGKGAVVTVGRNPRTGRCREDGVTCRQELLRVRDIKTLILAARHVMEDSPHVLLIGEGASSFCPINGFAAVENDYFSTPESPGADPPIKMRKEEPIPKGQ
jgi:beta-aspartyl-peptidase (threonine type)